MCVIFILLLNAKIIGLVFSYLAYSSQILPQSSCFCLLYWSFQALYSEAAHDSDYASNGIIKQAPSALLRGIEGDEVILPALNAQPPSIEVPPSDFGRSSLPNDPANTLSSHARLPGNDGEGGCSITNPNAGIRDSTVLQGMVSSSSQANLSEISEVLTHALFPSSLEEVSLGTGGGESESLLLAKRTSRLNSDECKEKKPSGGFIDMPHFNVNEQSSSNNGYHAVQSATRMVHPFSSMTDPRGHYQQQTALYSYPHNYPTVFSQGYPNAYSYRYPPGYPPAFLPFSPYPTPAPAGPLAPHGSQRRPLIAPQAPLPPQLNSGLPLNQSMPPAWSVPPQSGEEIPQGLQYPGVSREGLHEDYPYHLVSDRETSLGVAHFEKEVEEGTEKDMYEMEEVVETSAASRESPRNQLPDSQASASSSSSNRRSHRRSTCSSSSSSSSSSDSSSSSSEYQNGEDNGAIFGASEIIALPRPCFAEDCKKEEGCSGILFREQISSLFFFRSFV